MTPTRLLVQMGLRSVSAHRLKSLIVGGLLLGGTTLLVLGFSLLGSIERALEGSVTSSLSGQFQIYDEKAEDPLELFGSFGGGLADNGEIPDFGKVSDTLSKVPGVSAVVPMGIVNTTVFAPTELDSVLDDMRGAVRDGDLALAQALEPQVRRIAATFRAQQDLRLGMTNDPEAVQKDKDALDSVGGDPFWAPFHPAEGATPDTASMVAALDFLDNRVAPLASDGRLLYLRCIGTDLDQYARSFDRFYVVKGQMVPSGKRGMVLSDRTYERIIKNRVARELDDIHRQVTEDGTKIAESEVLREQIARNSRQYPRVVFQLSPTDADALQGELRAYLHEDSASLDDLVQHFLLVDDSNEAERYQWFQDHIAPRIRLYDIPIGSTITLRSFTKSGYLKTVNVRVYGTYEFKGLEKSDLASASNLTDLMTFRDLYGKMSSEQQAELADIRAASGVADVSRENAEDALFGSGSAPVEVAATAPQAPTEASAPDAPVARAAETDDDIVNPEEMRTGLVLNAAIILNDPTKADAMRPKLEQAIQDGGLGVQLVDWLTASGTIGQIIFVLRIILGVSFFIIYGVALIIVNNAMVMSTMDRVPEIGTMRAIGAQRGVVVWMFLVETVVLGLLSGALGAGLGAGLISLLGKVGIPAVSNQLVFLFAGPRLYPSWQPEQLLVGVGLVVAVALVSTLYPAFLASKVPPIVAMQGKE